jgi:hypothetical protein
MAYNPVPSEVIHAHLESMGFTREIAGKEVVYERTNHRLPSLIIRVYTSAMVGSSQVAECGKDAIRLVLLHRVQGHKDQPIRPSKEKKNVRVFRTGTTEAILGRITARARELYATANWIAETPPCRKCRGPCYRGSTTCVRFCWKNNSNGKGKAA